MKNKGLLVIVGSLLVVSICIGISYSFWLFSSHQNEANLAMTQCIDITMTDESEGITVEKGVPISDQEGKASKPYTFTITNTCDNAIAYNVNLEVLEEEDFPFHYMDIQMDDNDFKALDQYIAVLPTYKDDEYEATDSFELTNNILGANESRTHNVRMWIDKDTPEDAQGKSFLNKITVSATNIKNVKTTPRILAYQGEKLIKEISSSQEMTEDSIYSAEEVTFRLSGYDKNNTFYYSLSENGDKIKIDDGTLKLMPTLSGLTVYFYLEDEFGGLSENYTKVNLYLPRLDDIDYQIAAGESVSLDEIVPSNLENVVYGESSDQDVLTIENGIASAKKGGTVEVQYSTQHDGAVGMIRFHVSEITLEKENGFILVGNTKKISFDSINANQIEVSSSNTAVARVKVEGSQILVTPFSAGDTTISLKDENGYTKNYNLKVASVSLVPNGSGYLIDNNSVQIKTNITVINAEEVSYGWSNSDRVAPLSYEVLNTNEVVMDSASVGSHYLWVKLRSGEEEEIYVSKAFSVFENTIVIVPSTTDPTRFDYEVNVLYPSETVAESRKVGFGTSLTNAMNNISLGNSLQIRENGYIYAEAIDNEGNKLTATLEITNIDKTGPTTENIQVSKKNENEAIIHVTGIQDNANEVDGYFVTEEDRVPELDEYDYLFGDHFSKSVYKSGTYFIWIKDNLGNTSKFEINVEDIIEPIHDVTFNETYVALGNEKTLNLVYEGEYKSIKYASSNEDVVSIDQNGKVTALKPGSSIITITFTNHNEEEVVVSAPVYVSSILLSKEQDALKIGEEAAIKIEATNAGEITLETDNPGIADFEVVGDNLVVRPKSAGVVNVTVKESNAGAATNYTLSVVDVSFVPNGGSYQMPSNGNGTIESTVSLTGDGTISYAWSTSNSIEPASFIEITNNGKASKADCEGSTNYYLWIKVDSNASTVIFVSDAFLLMEDEIVITPEVSGYTNEPYNVTINYPTSIKNSTKKVGFGHSLNEAIENVQNSSVDSLTVSDNGYIYVEAEDEFGNKLIATHQVENFDFITAPVITGGSDTFINSRTISIETFGSASSGVKEYEYYISSVEDIPSANVTATGITDNMVTITNEGPNYIWYRTVSNGGTKSAWSNMQVANIYYRASSVTYTNSNNLAISNVQEALDVLYSKE